MDSITKEALHYLGISGEVPPDILSKVEKCCLDLSYALNPRHIYRIFDIINDNGRFLLGGTDVELYGNVAQKMLGDCQKAAIFTCTLGVGFDAMLRAKQARDMAGAVILDACGSAYVEKICDDVQKTIGLYFPNSFLTDRFSPGYGDMPLYLQKEFSALLNGEKNLGIHIGESFLINPSKTVTAVVGISCRPQMARIRGCEYCLMKNSCTLKKGGKNCGL